MQEQWYSGNLFISSWLSQYLHHVATNNKSSYLQAGAELCQARLILGYTNITISYTPPILPKVGKINLDGDQHLLDGASDCIFLAPLWPFSCIFSYILFAACLISEPLFADAPSCWILVVPFVSSSGFFLLLESGQILSLTLIIFGQSSLYVEPVASY